MIGIILCCHGEMAEGIRSAAELIVGPQQQLDALGIKPGEGQDTLRSALKKSIRNVGKDGVIILTDLQGGTPFNVAVPLLNEKVRMIAGFNLPLLLQMLMGRLAENDIDKLTAGATEHACQHIVDASAILSGREA
ncbi:MAG: PTS sugar transporter subunit IIA [Deltaproteobacteria bacterium]|nr:PTS sugar transporter subunit IIA [Deltaproteobacteria bacterium]MBN2671167.1 PTS sugar transporter subunit IIA [Deltaproteobacteria bacterium]